MNKLLKHRISYLAGPLDYATGEDWRTPVKKVLMERFGLNVFDPSMDPKQAQVPKLNQLKEEGKYDELSEIVHAFVRADLSIVDRSDIFIACLPHKVPVFGTVHEIIVANTAKKPTLLVCPEGKHKFAGWPFGFIRHEFMFGSWEDLYKYLQEVDDGLHANNDRWYFINHYSQKDGQWSFR
jgi:nucleoside 2-deoxyribosyltransferase